MINEQRPTLRPATSGDESAVFELAAQMAISFEPDRDAFRSTFTALLTTDNADLLVAVVDSQIAGYLLGFSHSTFYANGPVAWVEEIAVQERLRRRGIGASLMKEFETSARSRGARLVALATTRASSFYEALHYEPKATYFRKTF